MKIFIFVTLVLAIVLENTIILLELSRIAYDRGYNQGLEDGIRMTNEVISEAVRS